MTSKERVRRAMRLEVPDRVPVMCQMSIGHMLLQTGASPVDFWFSRETFSRGLLRLREQYQFDGILISLHGHSPDWEKSVRRRSRNDLGETVWWRDGSRTDFPGDDLPQHFPAKTTAYPDIAAFDPGSIPERLDFIPVSQGLEFPVDPEHAYDIFEDIIARAGQDYSIHGEVTSPFDYFLNTFGFSGGFLALVENPERAKAVLGRYSESVTKIALEQASLGIDALKISSPYAGAGFISPGFYREFVLPFERQIAEAVRSVGVPVYLHTCGAIRDRLETMAEGGISGIECLDPLPLGNVELAEAKTRVGSRIFIKGNVDPVHTLLFGSEEKVEFDVRSCLRAGMPGGGFILSTACSIAPRTSRRSIERLVGLASAEGVYGE